ncbi:MAG: Zn-dependent hydrolase [SAR324 cluster bacterium]|nr:Zn-dependent hydrolase [SAR324 cluster bacterium]
MHKNKILFFTTILIAALASNYLHYQIKTQKLELPNLETSFAERLFNRYVAVTLEADLSSLTINQAQMLPILAQACRQMDQLYLQQNWGDLHALGSEIRDPVKQKLLRLNYGPWEKTNGNYSFIPGLDQKPKGWNFYPKGLAPKVFDYITLDGKQSSYSYLKRNAEGKFFVEYYSQVHFSELQKTQELLEKASELAEHQGFKNYLKAVGASLRQDDFYQSDLAWVKLKDNPIDLIIGPIETYDDDLLGLKASFEGLLLLRDESWTTRLQGFSSLLPDLQNSLPLPKSIPLPSPKWDAGLGVYQVLLHCGQANAGIKAIAINLPNDPRIQQEHGSRTLQLKNVMEAKFKLMMKPLSQVLIHPSQLDLVTFNAFFENTLFHEVAHGLGVKKNQNGKTLSKTFGDSNMELEEAKADILSLYFLNSLKNSGKIESQIMEQYVTFVAGMIRTMRFGPSSAHGRAALVRWNFLHQRQAFIITDQGLMIHKEKMAKAVSELTTKILQIQATGTFEDYQTLREEHKSLGPSIRFLLAKVKEAKIPVDIYFEQGPKYWH